MQAPPNRPIPPANLTEILKFLSIPHSFQLEKLIRKKYYPSTAYLIDGINDIPQSGFAVALERCFHYDLDAQLGTSKLGYNYIKASFLEGMGAFANSADGIKIYFGLDTSQNKLLPILTQVKVIPLLDSVGSDGSPVYDPRNTEDISPYYVPADANDGNWVSITEQQFKALRANYKSAVAEINSQIDFYWNEKYKTQGYFIGRDAIMNVLSKANPATEVSTVVVRKGIKLYFGIQEKILYYDYEVGRRVGGSVGGGNEVFTSGGRDLHLILVGVDNPQRGPLASFSRIFATIETDIHVINDGVLEELNVHDNLTAGPGSPCVVEDTTS
jgi:hypothetical protein